MYILHSYLNIWFKPNIYQVWTFKEIILAMQAGEQKKHEEIPDPMFGYGGLQWLSELWPKIGLRNVDMFYEQR